LGLKDVFVSLLDLVRTEAVVDEAPNHFVALHLVKRVPREK